MRAQSTFLDKTKKSIANYDLDLLSRARTLKKRKRLGSTSETVDGSGDDEYPDDDYDEGPQVIPYFYLKHKGHSQKYYYYADD